MGIYERLPHTLNVAAYYIEEQSRVGRPDAPAYLHGGGSLTYGQLRDSVSRMAALLRAWGVEWEDRLALLLPDGPELVTALWGGIWSGAVPVPINVAYREDDIAYIIADCRAKVLITTSAWRERLSAQASPFIQRVVVVDEAPSLLTQLSQVTGEPEAAATTKDDSAFWLYTSGSTGRPKGAIHLQHDMIVCAQLYGKATIGLREGDIIYSVAPIPFAYGLGNTLYFPLAVGAAAVLADTGNAFDVIATIERYRPTVFFGIPSMFKAILDVADIARFDASSLRLCLSAAESLPPSIWHRWRERFGLEICEGIGTTELLHIFLSNRPGKVKPGSTGQVVEGYDVRVVDSSGNAVISGEVGDLVVGGESLMAGYWNRHRETRAAICGESMRTGDKYFADEQGYFYFAGRGDDRFKIGGQWVMPLEVEDVLLQHESVLDAAIVAEQGEDELPHVVAFIALKPGKTASATLERDLKRHARQHLAHFKSPQRIVFVEEVLRTATGKIDRHRLRTQGAGPTREEAL